MLDRDPSLPINDSPWRRIVLRLSLKVLRQWRPFTTPRVLLLTHGLILKYGHQVSLLEAHAIDFVLKHSSLPVPGIVTAFESKSGCKYILMKRIRGNPLSNVFHTMSEQTKCDILVQLREYINELRRIPPPKPGTIGAVDYTPLHDERVYNGAFGPFDSTAEFHRALRGGFEGTTGNAELDKMIKVVESRDYLCRLTHADLSFRNILTRDRKIVAFVDWETAGWYPDYWEYASTYYSFFDCPEARPIIDDFLEVYLEKRETERARRRLFNMM